jgi:hypothetical protein
MHFWLVQTTAEDAVGLNPSIPISVQYTALLIPHTLPVSVHLTDVKAFKVTKFKTRTSCAEFGI